MLFTEENISDQDAQFWMTDPMFAARRHVLPAEVLRTLIEEHLKLRGIDLAASNNAYFWNVDGVSGPEIIVVQMPEVAT